MVMNASGSALRILKPVNGNAGGPGRPASPGGAGLNIRAPGYFRLTALISASFKTPCRFNDFSSDRLLTLVLMTV